jgi:hypothetical protein
MMPSSKSSQGTNRFAALLQDSASDADGETTVRGASQTVKAVSTATIAPDTASQRESTETSGTSTPSRGKNRKGKKYKPVSDVQAELNQFIHNDSRFTAQRKQDSSPATSQTERTGDVTRTYTINGRIEPPRRPCGFNTRIWKGYK